MKTGFAFRDITAPIGADMPGAFRSRVNRGVLDRLSVSAAVIDNGSDRVAVVGVDALFITRPLAQLAFGMIESRTDLSRDQVLIGASHTHNGGPVFDGLMSQADPDVC